MRLNCAQTTPAEPQTWSISVRYTRMWSLILPRRSPRSPQSETVSRFRMAPAPSAYPLTPRSNDPNDPPSRRQSVTSAHEAGGLFQPEHLGSARPAPATTSSLSAVAPGLQAADTLDAVDSQQPDAPSRYQLSIVSPMFESLLDICNESLL